MRTLEAAREDFAEVVKLTQDLVRIRSRGGLDPYEPVLDCMESWLSDHDMACHRLAGPDGQTAALVCEVTAGEPGPRYVLDACLDTAPFGAEDAWTHPPLSGEITGGWLHGRGSSDSKAGAAIFAHVAARLRDTPGGFAGSVVLLFDVDEHTGGFGGAKAYFAGDGVPAVDGVMIGYPGLDHVVTGGRGVLRARIRVHGIASHSGSSHPGAGAISKAARLIRELESFPLPSPTGPGPGFPLPAKLTVTDIGGGEGYSTVPDLCTVSVDIRLTPALDDSQAEALLRSAAESTDAAWPRTPPTVIEVATRWPPYVLPAGSPLTEAITGAAAEAGLSPSAKVAGPSNIGNCLASLGVPAVAGFGVDYRGLHGTDERIRLDTVPVVQAIYHQALLRLLSRIPRLSHSGHVRPAG